MAPIVQTFERSVQRWHVRYFVILIWWLKSPLKHH